MSQRISFVDDDDDLTFVNYGGGSDYTYRREARIHNAQRGLRRARRAQSAAPDTGSQREVRRRGIGRQPRSAESIATPLVGIAGPIALFAPDQSSYDFSSPPRSFEAIWRSTFPTYFYLPRLSTSSTVLPDPEDTFLAAARSSPYAYRNLVTLTAIDAEARRGATAVEDVFRNQAQIIQDFRGMVQRYTELETQLTRQDIQDIFIAAFSFFGRDFGKEPAYNAIIDVNSTVLYVAPNRATRLLPTVEWIRLLLPRPGESFNRTQTYQSLMLRKANALTSFLERTQNNAISGLTTPFARYFHPETAIYKVITTSPSDHTAPEPYPGFYLMCVHRILFLLHTHINELAQANQPAENDAFLSTMESVASTCLEHPSPERLAIFLWGVLVNSDAQDTCNDPDEMCYLWAMKDLYHIYNLTFVREMIAWLPREGGETTHTDLPVVDVEAMRVNLRAHYEPNGPSGGETLFDVEAGLRVMRSRLEDVD